MRQSCDWRQDETHKATWNFLTTSLLLQFWRTKTNKQTNKKRCVKSHILSKENKISTELLLGIYLTKLNKEERRRKSQAPPVPGLGRGKRLHTPPLSLPSPSCCRGRVWVWQTVTPIGHIWIFFFSQYSDPTPTPSVPLHLPHTLHLSPMVLSFQLTKHLT